MPISSRRPCAGASHRGDHVTGGIHLGPYSFILDTGASITVVGKDLARELSLVAAAGVNADARGGGAAPTIVTVDALRLGDATIGGFMAAVMPLAEFFKTADAPQGVLSASSFPGCLVIFDYPGRRVTIKKGALDDAVLPTIPIRIAGQKTQVHLDTGSASTLTLPRRFLSELPLVNGDQDPRESGE